MGLRNLIRPANLLKCCIPIMAILTIWIINSWTGEPFFTLAPLFAILAMSIYHGGVTPAIVIGLMIIAYSFYASPSLIRATIISVSTVFIVAPVAILSRVRDNVDTILIRLRDLDILLTGADIRWHALNEAERLEILRQAKYKTAHLLTFAMGWHELARERDALLDDYDKKLDT